MKYKKLLIVPFLFIAPLAFSQSDSLAVSAAEWQSQKITRGVKLKTHGFNKNLFNSNQNVSILQVKPGRRIRIGLGADAKILKKTSEFGLANNAIAALNGTFFDMKNGGSQDYIRSQGKVINYTQIDQKGQRGVHQRAAICIKNGKVKIVNWDSSPNWEEKLAGEDIMVTGPVLLAEKKRTILDSTAFSVTRHPRSVLAIKGDKILLITVDGRNQNAAGMNLFELASFLRWMNADNAINLDGGGSTTLWVKGQPDNGVVNYPSDNKKWDHAGERKVANVILVKKKQN